MHVQADSGLIAASVRDLEPFELIVPGDLGEATTALAAAERPAVYAGGTDLCAAIREGAVFRSLVWLRRIEELRRIEMSGDRLHVGALATLAECAASDMVRKLPGLAEAMGRIGNVRIRFRATVGGNIMAGRARYEMAILALALGADLRFADKAGERRVPVADFVPEGPAPARDARSILSRIEIPLLEDLRLDYDRTLRPMFTLALALWRGSDGRQCGRAVIATGLLPPVCLPVQIDGGSAATVAEGAFRDLPETFADAFSGNAYLRRAGAAILARQLRRLGGLHD